MKADVIGVGKLISERGNFRVPDHQREYAWPTGAVEQFLEDIEIALKRNESDYFIGLIVLVEPTHDTSWQILDGQQRLATTTMVYSAIRSWLKENGFDKDAQKVQERYIGISELGEEKDRPRIALNVKDRSIFENVVANQVSDNSLEEERKKSGRNSSKRKLLEALIACRSFIAKLAKESGEDVNSQAKILFTLADYIRDNVHVAFMDVASSGNAYVIFESLNDRGIDLSVLDLVKNYVFSKAGTDLKKVQYNWIRMTTTLADRKADDFLKVFWTSRYGRVQRGALFNKIKSKYNRKALSVQLSEELCEAVELYAALDSHDSDIWAEHSEETKEYIKTLTLLAGTQVRPIILSALLKFNPNKIERLLYWLVSLIVRYQTVGGGRTGRLEQQCASVAPKIFSGDLKSPQSVWDQIKTIIPKDDEFINDFKVYKEATAAKARYIISRIEVVKWKSENPDREIEKIPCPDPNILNLEHILPKNPSKAWNNIISNDKHIVSDLLNNIGNLCLLSSKANKKIGSSSFEEKIKNIYCNSEILTTNELAAKYTKWDRSSIESRAEEMAKLAVNAWPVDN
jgi:predicted nucleic acid-binding protein